MQIRFLLGPAGSGKTFRCLSEIRHALKASPDGPLILLAPKQATFQLERQLLADDSLRGYTRLRILSFERLARFVFDQLGQAPPKMLDEEGRLMVLRALLAKKRGELKLFRASARLTGFAQQLSLTLREFQSNRLTPADLRKFAVDTQDFGLSAKLHDLALLLESYLEWLREHGLLDVNCLLEATSESLKSSIQVPSSKFQVPSSDRPTMIGGLWMDGFAELSAQELDLLAAVAPRCARATLAFCLDCEAKSDSWLSHWMPVRKTVDECRKRLAAVAGVTICTEDLACDAKKSRFAVPILAEVEESWFAVEPVEHGTRFVSPERNEGGNTQHALRFITCADPDAEAIFAAREILKFVRTPRIDGTQNRFRDAAVLVRDLEKYHEPLQRVFLRYNIPFFLDRRESVAHHPLAELTRSAWRTIAFQWAHDDWFAALKTGLVPADELEIDRLENEALAHGWKGAAWQEPIQMENDARIAERLEALRKKIIAPFNKLASRLAAHQNRPTGPRVAEALRGFWLELNVEQQLERWAEETPATAFAAPRSVHATVWEQMNAWLRNIELAFGDEPVAVRDWLPVLEAGLANLTVGVIPPALDQVLIGAIDRSRNPELKLALALGMNETVFPATPGASALLTDADRDALARRGAELGPSVRERMARERYLGYIACTRASEQLAVTCARQDARGAALNPSLFMTQLQQVFPGVEMEEFSGETDWRGIEHVFELLPGLLRGEIVDSGALESLPKVAPVLGQWQRWSAQASPEKLTLSAASVAALYGRELQSSISALEMFAGCPFQFFVRCGLRADERALFEADPRQTGTFQHEILSRFHEQLREEKKRWRDISPQEARERIGRIGFELSRTFGEGLFEADERSRFMARTLIEQLQSLMAALVAWMRQYEFDPREVELSFGLPGADLPPWKLPLGGGKSLALRGKIDRIDLWHVPGTDDALAVIVDYKSGGKKLDPIFLHHGMQLQLLSYLNALMHLPEPKKVFGVSRILPAGVFYVPLRARADSVDSRNQVFENAEANARTAYQHTGRFDGEAILQLDNRGLPKGDQFKYTRKNDGGFSKVGNEAMTPTAFRALLEKIAGDLRNHGERIFAGDAGAKPFRKGADRACDWCQCQPVCRFDSWIHPFNVLRKPKDENEDEEKPAKKASGK
ncbi:MAG TPA: PD-(D/E)XK nuclease family protein [Candidatus Angelobacter sp.]|nr:PD-(D/E)XK nuclease family protein [Candidatus Angelobacter sp.]